MIKKITGVFAQIFNQKSIRTEVLALLLCIVSISVIAVIFLEVSSILILRDKAQETTSVALRGETEKLFNELTKAAAEKNDLIFHEIATDASKAAKYAENIFENPQAFVRGSYWRYDDQVFRGDKGQYMNGADDLSSVFIPNHVVITDDLKKRVELSAYLEFIFPKILEKKPDAVAIWMIGHQGESRYYPNIGLGNIAPPDEKVTEEVFFVIANPENNPEKEVVWTPVYDDPAGQGLMITASAPIYTKQKGFMGVLGIDVTLTKILENVEEYSPIEDADSFIIDERGYAIALSDEAHQELLGRSPEKKEFGVDLNGVTKELDSVISEMKKGSTGNKTITLWGREQYISYAPMKSTKFSLGMFVEKSVMEKTATGLEKEMNSSAWEMIFFRLFPLSLLILLVAWLVVYWYMNHRITQPLSSLTRTAEELSGGKMEVRSDIVSENEIGQLAKVFNQMAAQLQEHYSGLQQKVEERTTEVEKTKGKVETVNQELLKKVEELDRINKLMIDRELKMIEMKKEVEALRQAQGKN